MIKDQIDQIKLSIPENVTLVAVSKTKPNEMILEAYAAGQRVFGENRPKELQEKYSELPKDIEWHMIGHLQRKNVKFIAPFVSLVHGVDSFQLLQEINKQAAKNDRVQDVLLQFHVAQEETKFGFELEEAEVMLKDEGYFQLTNIRVRGIMGMASFTSDSRQIREEFFTLRKIFEQLADKFFGSEFDTISMGMSGDYEIAIQEGSTMIRVGSSIFGGRH